MSDACLVACLLMAHTTNTQKSVTAAINDFKNFCIPLLNFDSRITHISTLIHTFIASWNNI